MKPAYLERGGFRNSHANLEPLRAKWRICRVDEVMQHVAEVLLEPKSLRKGVSVSLVGSLDAGGFIFPPMWRLQTPRITSSWRYEIFDAEDINVIDSSHGTTRHADAYTLGLTQDAFYGQYEWGKANLLGSFREIASQSDLLHMVDMHLKMGRENRLKEWGRN